MTENWTSAMRSLGTMIVLLSKDAGSETSDETFTFERDTED